MAWVLQVRWRSGDDMYYSKINLCGTLKQIREDIEGENEVNNGKQQ